MSVEAKPKTCDCKHEWQEKRYGKNKRLHNPTSKKKGEDIVWRCTVCGKEKT